MFFRDISKMRYRTPRALYEACGPYAKLHVPRRKSRIAPVLWAILYGVAIGAFWYALVLARAA